MQVDSPKNFSLYLYTPEGVPKSKVVFSKFLKCYKNSGKGLQFSV